MSFIQITEFTADDVDAISALHEEWRTTTEGKRTARRAVLCQDRNNPHRYLNMVFFDSFESAMQNSELPETQAMATKLAGLVSGTPIFHNLDVVADVS